MNFKVQGLSPQEVEESRAKHGSNVLTEQSTETFWDKLLENLKDPMIIILLVALVVVLILSSLGYTEWYEGIGIAFAVALATLVSTFSEFKNEQTFQKLQAEASQVFLNVFRGKEVRKVSIDEIVVGDRVFLEPGDKVPADAFVVEGSLKINQAMLNGEPDPVTKKPSEHDDLKLDGVNAVFRGTVVTDGEAVIEVQKVGDKTLFGELAQSLKAENKIGPLRSKLAVLANQIAKFGYFGAPLIAVAFMFKVVYIDHAADFAEYFNTWQLVIKDVVLALILAVIIIVVVVPEGLPMMIAIVLAQNMRKLLKSKVLVRQLLGIETAGSLNILFSDKTGTITKGELEAVGFYAIDESRESGYKEYKSYTEMPALLSDLLITSLVQNTSAIINTDMTNMDEAILGGNTTDRALLKFVEANKHKQKIEKGKTLEQVLFSSARKFSSSYVEFEDGTKTCLIKGASERILAHATHFYNENKQAVALTDELRQRLSDITDKKADEGYRLIGIAASTEAATEEKLPSELTLIGFSLIRDELRDDSVAAIKELQQAGIQVVMITGDRHGTAIAIAKDAGLMQEGDLALESEKLQELSDEEVKQMLPNLKVVSRCLPQDKTRLVKLAQELQLVVGMTGDGVNDSPALSNADVGFGLGSGTDVVKEASDIVVLDDRLSSISSAVHYGRTIYRSVQKFITFQLTVNLSAILLAFIGPFLGFELPLTMIQLLWINLIMDTLAALAFSGEPPLEKHMQEMPKAKDEPIISKPMWQSIIANGLFITAISIWFLKADYVKYWFYRIDATAEMNELVFLTAFFAIFVFFNNFNKFNVRVEGLNIFDHISKNSGFTIVITVIFLVQVFLTYFGGELFRTVGLTLEEWGFVLLISILIIPFDLLRKAIVKS